jgi:mRNA interferase RelE/StbE
MSDSYRVEWAPSAKRDLIRLAEKAATAAVEFIYGGLADSPHRVGRALHLELVGLHAARRGDFRVVYRIDKTSRRVVITRIDDRADVYRRQ